jgi:hypothetical protein
MGFTYRFLLGFSNFWTVAFLPGWLCSFLSILVESKGRRGQLATHVTNVVSMLLWRLYLHVYKKST